MIRINVRGIEEVQKLLDEVKDTGFKRILESVAEYLVGDPSHGLKHYPAYKYVSKKQAGGFASDKQRRYVMARIREGSIDPGAPHRTGELQRGWYYRGRGKGFYIANETPYAQYVMGNTNQSRMHGIIGWRVTAKVIKDNMAGALRHARMRFRMWAKARGK